MPNENLEKLLELIEKKNEWRLSHTETTIEIEGLGAHLENLQTWCDNCITALNELNNNNNVQHLITDINNLKQGITPLSTKLELSPNTASEQDKLKDAHDAAAKYTTDIQPRVSDIADKFKQVMRTHDPASPQQWMERQNKSLVPNPISPSGHPNNTIPGSTAPTPFNMEPTPNK